MYNNVIFNYEDEIILFWKKYLKHISMKKKQQKTLEKDYRLHLSRILGSGSTGSVYEGTQLATNSEVAIKVIDLETIDNQVSQYLLKMEQHALMTVNHPNILRCYHIYQENMKCYLVTQYCNGGTLKDVIHLQGHLSQQKTFQIIEGLLCGYLECVRKKIIHRDIKPANIMLHDNQPKLIDFGYCMIEGYPKPTLEYNVGSPSYMAPESYKWNLYNQKTQIWAIGITIYQCLTGKTLDEGRKMSLTFKELLEIGISFPSNITQKSKNIVQWCLEYDPKNRPNTQQLLLAITSKQQSPSFYLNQKDISSFLRNPSQNVLNSLGCYQIPYKSHKKLENTQIKISLQQHSKQYKKDNTPNIAITLFDSKKINQNLGIVEKKQTYYPEIRKRYLSKVENIEPYSNYIGKRQIENYNVQGSNYKGSVHYFYKKLTCNTFR